MPSLIVFRSSVNTIIYPYTYPIRATDSFPPWARWLERRDVMRNVGLSAMERIQPLAICEAKYNVGVISLETLDMNRTRTMMMMLNTSMH
jgi:hypothetical protein